MAVEFLNPAGVAAPVASYSQIARVRTPELLFVAGQVGARADWSIPADFDEQCALTFQNIAMLLEACGASLAHVVQLTSYLVDPADISRYREWREAHFPTLFPAGRYPTNSLLIVSRLVRPELRVEVTATAAR